MKQKLTNLFRRRNIRRGLLCFVLLCLAALIFVAAVNLHMLRSAKPRIITREETAELEADCILVLGAGVWEDNRPSAMLADRLDEAIALYELGGTDRLLMSGDHGREEYDEVNVMKAYAIDAGVPSEHIFMDHAGFSTYESLYRARDVFCAERVIIVTQEYHLYRALYIAQALGLEAWGVASDPRDYMGQGYRELREAAARAKDWVCCLIQLEPSFLGEAIPVSGNGDATNDR